MSLIINDTFRSVSITGAIAVIGGITIPDDHTNMTFSVTYRTISASPSDYYNTEYYSCAYDANKGDIVMQAYAYLKTLPKFADATEQ